MQSTDLIVRVRTITRTSRRTLLLRVEPGRPFPFVAGQAVMAGLALQHVRRPYSIASSPEQVRATGLLDLVVGLDDGGTPGAHLTPLEPGSLLGLRGPLGRFGLPPRLSRRSLLFVAGGTGIAPLRSMLWSALARVPAPSIDVVFSARTPADLVFNAEFHQLAEEGRIRYWPTVTRRAGGSWKGRRGRIDRDMLADALRPLPVCLVCGSASFVEDMTVLLRSLDVGAASIRREES